MTSFGKMYVGFEMNQMRATSLPLYKYGNYLDTLIDVICNK